MELVKKINGRVFHSSKESLFIAQNYSVIFEDQNGKKLKWISFPKSIIQQIVIRVPILSRLLRRGIHHLLIDTKNGSAFALVDKDFWYITPEKNLVLVGRLKGSRPLAICYYKDTYYYGEYQSNPDRNPSAVWSWKPGEKSWQKVWEFENIRHIHGIFHDSYSDSIWITTGDNDSESAIWNTKDQFQTVNRIIGGSQQTRTIQLLFSEDYIYFGSDTPNEKNFIYRLKRNELSAEKLQSVGGSIFYGTKIKNSFLFSTAVEPSDINTSNLVEVWGTNNGNEWKQLYAFKKDILSKKLFQYGQVYFPNVNDRPDNIFLTPYATSLGSIKTYHFKT